jgi:hypothetical protein
MKKKVNKESNKVLPTEPKDINIYKFINSIDPKLIQTIFRTFEVMLKLKYKMTREAFIKKWLGNADYQYNEQNKDLMRSDLDEIIATALLQPDIKDLMHVAPDKLISQMFSLPIVKVELILKELENRLNTRNKIPYHKDSIMAYDKICNHDDGYLCEHRRTWIIEFIKSNFP